MSEIDLEFFDHLPRTDHLGWGVWEKWLTPLIQHPGKWARVRCKTRKRSTLLCLAQRINHRQIRMPPGIWRAATRNGEIYVCYCSAESEPQVNP